MIQGSSSSAGKSLMVTALCRILARRGLRVAPFKAQNMSNNAAVCADGAEIGRSQAVQAAAAGVPPRAEMNPVLLKPEGNARSQVIAMGRPRYTVSARDYYRHKSTLWPLVTSALDCLRDASDVVVIEGAGSPAELNLRAGDIVNMAIARYAQAPVLLVGDIDRGGIFAQLLGTLWLLEPEDRALMRGFIVNKFRGDPTLFTDGVRIIEDRGKLPVLGVVPFIPDLAIPEEDSAALDLPPATLDADADAIDIAVIRLPRIANFDDFVPLAAEPGVRLRYVTTCATLGTPQAVIIPGSKSTIADLDWLRAQGLALAIRGLAERGAAIVGICGGYQMLGDVIRDPDRVEAAVEQTAGLGLLPMQTVFEPIKATHQAEARVLQGPGWLETLSGETIRGYEIHMGQSTGRHPWLKLIRRSAADVDVADGNVTADGQIWGCYLHGLFENEALRRAWLRSLGWQPAMSPAVGPTGLAVAIDHLADGVEASLDMTLLETMIWDA
jgi:adenosylcobyric acid synthase